MRLETTPKLDAPLAVCVWRANEEGAYETMCGNIFEFYADGPQENDFRFCPYCGNPLHT